MSVEPRGPGDELRAHRPDVGAPAPGGEVAGERLGLVEDLDDAVFAAVVEAAADRGRRLAGEEGLLVGMGRTT